MKQLLILMMLVRPFSSCHTKSQLSVPGSDFQLHIPDTTNNRRANWDSDDINYRSKIENKIGLSDLKKGADSLEIRLWYDFSFSNSQELYILKFKDTSCFLSYYRIYPRNIDYNNENRNREWNPYVEPIIDSSISKTVLISKQDYKALHLDSIWFLKSQSELKISDSVGFTDCDSYILEIADRGRFKYLRHHCAMGYYEKVKLPEILTFVDYCERIVFLASKFDVRIPYEH